METCSSTCALCCLSFLVFSFVMVECAICFEELKSAFSLSCGHSFCQACSYQVRNKCALCRQNSLTLPTPNYAFNSLVEENYTLKHQLSNWVDKSLKADQRARKCHQQLLSEQMTARNQKAYLEESICLYCSCPAMIYIGRKSNQDTDKDVIRCNFWKTENQHFILQNSSSSLNCQITPEVEYRSFLALRLQIFNIFENPHVEVCFKEADKPFRSCKIPALLTESLNQTFPRANAILQVKFDPQEKGVEFFLDSKCTESKRVSRFRVLKEQTCPISCHPGLIYYFKLKFCISSEINTYFPFKTVLFKSNNPPSKIRSIDCEMKILS